MNASAVVRGLFRIPRAGPAFGRTTAGASAAPQPAWDARVESIRNILGQEGRTVTQLSAATRRCYGIRSPYFIPSTFLYRLKSGVTPHVCQIVALSESTGYRFVDWLQICGFDLRQIPRLQMRLHPERTVIVTPVEDCFERRSSSSWSHEEEWSGGGRYLFARIGSRDAQLCPRLLPGSIVRVDRGQVHRPSGVNQLSLRNLLWMVEHAGGLTCCRVRWIDDRQIVLLPNRPPWGSWPLRLPTEARVLGFIDDIDLRATKAMTAQVESRPLSPRSNQGPWGKAPADTATDKEDRTSFSDLLRKSRGRAGLTFRAAHRLTRVVAQVLENPDYAIALGTLSDYEVMGRLPRQIAKMLSLCMVYCMDIRDLLGAADVRIDDSAKSPLPLTDCPLQPGADFPDHATESDGGAALSRYARPAGARP